MIEQKLDINWRREIINGTVVNMAPRPSVNHSTISGNIYRVFANYLKGKQCRAYGDGVYVRIDKTKDIELSDKNKKDRLIPDVMIVCRPEIIKNDGVYGTPDLVVEVLSPSTAKNDKTVKKDIYELIGVKEYWIVSSQERSIEIYLLNDGKYELDDIYHLYSEDEIRAIMEDDTEEDKTIVKEFKTSLYDDLIISIEDVFDKMI